jgi:hypothetical protein
MLLLAEDRRLRCVFSLSQWQSSANAIKQFVARENASRAESWHADGAERTWYVPSMPTTSDMQGAS